MLVAALGVEVGGDVGFGAAEVGVGVEDGVPGGAGLEPDVEDVHLLAEVVFCAAVVAGGAGGKELGDVVGVPGVGALFFEELDDERLTARSLRGVWQRSQRKTAMGTPQMRWREMHQSGRVAIMLEMRSSPQAGVPLHFLDLVEGALAEGGDGGWLTCRGRRGRRAWGFPWR